MNDNLIEDLPAWDQGRLLAHQISAGPTDIIERSLNKARRRRRGVLAWFSPRRRRFLEGLISGLENALVERRKEHRRSGKRHGDQNSGNAPA